MKFYVMGNFLVEIDSLPVKILPLLKKEMPMHEFIEFDPSEDFQPENKSLNIIDTVLDINKVRLTNDIDKIIVQKAYSLHDFDLGYNLKLLKKFGMIEKVNIIGVPPTLKEDEAVEEIKEIITKITSS
jgi:Ni,Fe-hydrogenase maturation factor